MNKVMLIGRLARDPDNRMTTGSNPMSVTRITVVINRNQKKEDGSQQADFIGCIAFGKNADNIGKYFVKGNRIAIEGRIQTGSYTNKEGNKVYTTDVVVDRFEFVESKAEREAAQQAPTDRDGFMNIPDGVEDEGLPFN